MEVSPSDRQEDRPSASPGRAATDAADLLPIRRQIAAAIARLRPHWLASEQEDLVQSTLVRVLAAMARSGERGINSTYLVRTAHSVLLDELGRAHRRRESQADPQVLDGSLRATSPDPHRAQVARELGVAVGGCLTALAVPRRRAVTLHLLGFLPAESARICDWDVKRVSNLVQRGLVDLRLCLQGKGIAP